jgi:hypothetical protein
MFGSEILDVAVGILFVFVVVSSICSAVREGIEAMLKTRASHLEIGVRELLHDPNAEALARSFFEHPLISGLYGGRYASSRFHKWLPTMVTSGRNLPSYIPSRNFALAVMDMAARGAVVDAGTGTSSDAPLTLDQIRAGVHRLNNPAVQRVLLTAIDTAHGDFDRAVKNVETWYDSAMDRVSGWYKRSTQWILFALGLFVAIGLNVDTLRIANHLYTNKTARDIVMAQVTAEVQVDPALGGPGVSYETAKQKLAAMPIPIGPKYWPWNEESQEASTDLDARLHPWMMAILGWLITALAATLGAPFWFDLLNKVSVIRSTVKPHEKSQEEASEDRQLRPKAAAPQSNSSTTPADGEMPQGK